MTSAAKVRITLTIDQLVQYQAVEFPLNGQTDLMAEMRPLLDWLVDRFRERMV